jgi:hypothetical protein
MFIATVINNQCWLRLKVVTTLQAEHSFLLAEEHPIMIRDDINKIRLALQVKEAI